MNDFRIGQHEASIKYLVDEMAALRADVTAIREALAERRGERRVALWTAGGVGGLVSFLGPILLRLLGLRVGA